MYPDPDPDPDPGPDQDARSPSPSPSRPDRAGDAETRRGLLDLARARAAGRRLARVRRALASLFIVTGAPAAALSWSGLVRTSQSVQVQVPIPALVLGATASTVAPLLVWALYREWQNDRRTEELLTRSLTVIHSDEGQASALRAAT